MPPRLSERGGDARAVARARSRRRHGRARCPRSSACPRRPDRIRERPRRSAVRRGHRVSGTRRPARHPARAHRLPQRRSVARRGARTDRPGDRGGARLGLTVAVIGAGLAGLSAAWELAQAGVEVTVLESERRLGGIVLTERRDGFIVEGGPDGFLAADLDIQALARELGLGDRLVDQLAKGSSLWTGRRLEPLAEGRAAELLGIQLPTDVGAQHAGPLHGGFRSFAGGMAEITEALGGRLDPLIRRAQGVTGIAPTTRGWRLAVTGGSQLEAEGVVVAVPAWAAARLLAAAGVPGARGLDGAGRSEEHTSGLQSLAYFVFRLLLEK